MDDPIGTAFRVVNLFDYVHPIAAVIENAIHGDAVVLAVPYCCPQVVQRIEAEFEIWGRIMMDGHDSFVFSVHKADLAAVQAIIGEECG